MGYFLRICGAFVLMVCGVSASAQKIDSYLSDMGEALVPFGTITSNSCHNVEIDLTGPWGHFAIPDGFDKDKPEDYTWSVVSMDVRRLYVDLADLDEDKVQNKAIFSMEYISNHKRGTRYVADTPMVMIFTHGLNAKMTVHTVDLDKVHALEGHTKITESQMGISLNERKFAIIPFSDQQHANVFEKAISKAIVLCKAQ